MKKVTIEIDDKFAALLTVTVIGQCPHEVNVSTVAANITQHNRITFGHDGKAVCNYVKD